MSQINQMNQNNPASDKQGNLTTLLMLRFSGSGGTVGQTKANGREAVAGLSAASGMNDGFDTVLKERMMTAKMDIGKTDGTSDRKGRTIRPAMRATGDSGAVAPERRSVSAGERGRIPGSTQDTPASEPDAKPVGTAKKTAKTGPAESGSDVEEEKTAEESPMEALSRILQVMLALAAEMANTSGDAATVDLTGSDGTDRTGETATIALTDILAGNAQEPVSTEAAKSLLALLSLKTGEADASLADALAALLDDAGGKASEFLQKLAELLQQAGVGSDALKSLSLKLRTVAGGDAVMLKLDAVAEGIRIKLHGVVHTAETADSATAALETPGGVPVASEVLDSSSDGSTGEDGNGTGHDTGMDGSRATEKAVGKETPMTEKTGLAPVNAASGTTTANAASVQQAGIRNGAAGGNMHVDNRQNPQQATRTNFPGPLADPRTSASVTGQLTAKVSELTGEARHEMELQLKPESLGKINLKLVEEKGQILARFTAESEQVRAILESNMQLLKDALEKNGLSVQQLSVSVGQQSDRGRQDGQEDGGKGNERGNAFGTKGVPVAAAFGQQDANLSVRVRDYLNGPNSTISLKA